MRWIGGHGHAVRDERRPPHSLLFSDGRDRADTGSNKADERDVRLGGMDDATNVGVGCGVIE